MSGLLDGLARYLADVAGVGVYDPSGAAQTADWSLWPDGLPSTPDRAIALTVYGPGAELPDPSQPWAETRVQVRVRGSADPRESRDKATAVYGALHGLERVVLPGGLWVQDVTARQGEPAGLGPDGAGRHEHTINFDVSYDQPTEHRPALEG